MTAGPALLCSDRAAEVYSERLATAAPGWDRVLLVGEGPISDGELAGVEAAFLSADTFPGRTGTFLREALRAPNLRWLHTFSAGIDHPIFGQFTQRACG